MVGNDDDDDDDVNNGWAGGHLCGEEAAWELLWLRSRGQLAADRPPPRQEPWQADLGPSGSLAPRSCLALSC